MLPTALLQVPCASGVSTSSATAATTVVRAVERAFVPAMDGATAPFGPCLPNATDMTDAFDNFDLDSFGDPTPYDKIRKGIHYSEITTHHVCYIR